MIDSFVMSVYSMKTVLVADDIHNTI